MSSEALLLVLSAIAITVAATLTYVNEHAEELERGAGAPATWEAP